MQLGCLLLALLQLLPQLGFLLQELLSRLLQLLFAGTDLRLHFEYCVRLLLLLSQQFLDLGFVFRLELSLLLGSVLLLRLQLLQQLFLLCFQRLVAFSNELDLLLEECLLLIELGVGLHLSSRKFLVQFFLLLQFLLQLVSRPLGVFSELSELLFQINFKSFLLFLDHLQVFAT